MRERMHRSYPAASSLKPRRSMRFADASGGRDGESVAASHQTFHTCDVRMGRRIGTVSRTRSIRCEAPRSSVGRANYLREDAPGRRTDTTKADWRETEIAFSTCARLPPRRPSTATPLFVLERSRSQPTQRRVCPRYPSSDGLSTGVQSSQGGIPTACAQHRPPAHRGVRWTVTGGVEILPEWKRRAYTSDGQAEP